MTDDPTDSTPTPSAGDDVPAAPRKAPRRRATKAAAPAEPAPAETFAASAEASAAEPAAVAAPADGPAEAAPGAPAVPVKRTRARKAPAKKAVAVPPEPVGSPGAESAQSAGTDLTSPEAPVQEAAAAELATAEPAGEALEAEPAAEPAAADPAAAEPAKKAPRKRAARKAAAPQPVEPVKPEDPTAALPEGNPVAEALLDAGPPVVEAVEDDPVVAEQAAADVTSPALAAPGTAAASTPADATPGAPAQQPERAHDEPAPDEPAPRARRRRAPAVVTFVAPDETQPAAARPATVPASPASAPVEADDQSPAPRRRRRAGTSGAVAPADLLPTLLPPAVVEELPPPVEAGLDDDEDDDGRPRRRRRGRRGRGPRRDEETAEVPEEETPTAPEGADSTEGSADDTEGEEDDEETVVEADDAEGAATRRRRRRRRRSGSSGSEENAEDDVPTVVHVREPRTARVRGASAADEDGVRGITGSTRMAAKRVRRQEGRDSGRRRAPVLTEAEFLARRESVERQMIVRQRGEMTQIAVLEDGVLVEHYVTKASAQAFAGNVYLGRVQNVLPSMEAAFIDIGKGRNGVLYAGEVNFDGSGSRKIEQVLKSGQEVLVQVSKDPIGHKGARLTSQVSLPGRYLVYVPEGSMTGISRKLPENERARLKSILKKVVPEDAGVIIRTAAEGATEEEIAADVRRLQAQWEVLETKAKKGGAPVLLHGEADLVIRVVRDVFNEDFVKLVVQGDSAWETIRDYVEFVAPDLAPRLSRAASDRDVFAEHRIDEQLLKALDRKVYLPSGGSLVIDRTEAMVVIDVNTGKYVGKGGNLEETVTRNNLEAAEEIARQLRLRDLGGIIVVDFIDMVLESNRDLVVRRLVECLGRDRTKHQVAEVTSLGLVQMTRKRVGQGLLESFSQTCDSCGGRGVHVRTDVAGAPVGSRLSDNGAGIERVAAALKPKSESPAQPPGTEAAGEPDEPAERPRRRRRGGRGSGAATLAPQDEMSELLAEPAGSEIPPEPLEGEQAVLPDADAEPEPEPDTVLELDAVADAPATVAADPAAGSAPSGAPAELAAEPDPGSAVDPAAEPDVEPDVELTAGPEAEPDIMPLLSEQPLPEQEDRPVTPAEEPAQPAGEPAQPAVEPAQPAGEPAPRRRRRATSRPAGPPSP